MEYLERTIEDIIEKSAQVFKAVLVTGARQTGKSTLFNHLFPNVKTVSFDDAFLEDQAKENPSCGRYPYACRKTDFPSPACPKTDFCRL